MFLTLWYCIQQVLRPEQTQALVPKVKVGEGRDSSWTYLSVAWIHFPYLSSDTYKMLAPCSPFPLSVSWKGHCHLTHSGVGQAKKGSGSSLNSARLCLMTPPSCQ